MSIRRYLVLILFSLLTLITFIAAIQGYKQSMSQAEKQFDRQLLDLAHVLLTINTTVTTSTHETLSIIQKSTFAFQVWKDQQLIIKSNNAPDHHIKNNNNGTNNNNNVNITTEFFEVNFLQKRWRALSLTKIHQLSNLNIIVAQPLKAQFELTQTLILAAVTPMIVAVVVLSILIFIIVTQGLKPLHQLTQELSNRKSNDFSPLKINVHNNELANIVATLNQLFSRLNAAFQRERYFASDAAHELKTPLSVLKIDTHNLIQELVKQSKNFEKQPLTSNTIENFSSIQALKSSVDRMGHVIDQLLNLNRTSPSQMISSSSRFNLNVLLKQVISELYNDIVKKNQTISLESEEVFITAHQLSIHLLAVNLISNANKYTPTGGEIKVSVKQIQCKHPESKSIKPQSKVSETVLIIEDSGPGINSDEFERVFDRFYRVGGDQHNSMIMGCGLGLAIVKHIADLHGAEIRLSRSEQLKGLKVVVIFPANHIEKVLSCE